MADYVPRRLLRGVGGVVATLLVVIGFLFVMEVGSVALQVAYFKSTGEGWQARMDSVLKEYVAQQARRT